MLAALSRWCRLEQWARLAVGGLERMYIYDGDSAKSIAQNPEWYQDSIRVFDGKFTNDDDKKSLVPTIMALWATVLRNRDANQDSVGVKFNYADVFPKEFFGELMPILEDRVAMESEEIVDDDTDIDNESSYSEKSFSTRKRAAAAARRVRGRDGALFKAFKASQAAASRRSFALASPTVSPKSTPASPLARPSTASTVGMTDVVVNVSK
jgi:hypothetical protein